ncbi:hypothetical protein AD930_00635 [Acetobacter malorum]|nr:hypothetical protein AD930_00635 [Acetobacter malorum]
MPASKSENYLFLCLETLSGLAFYDLTVSQQEYKPCPEVTNPPIRISRKDKQSILNKVMNSVVSAKKKLSAVHGRPLIKKLGVVKKAVQEEVMM